jgi:hypothetical protein
VKVHFLARWALQVTQQSMSRIPPEDGTEFMLPHDVDAVKRTILDVGLEDWVDVPHALYAARQTIFQENLLDSFPDNFDERANWLAAQEREALPLVVEAVKQLVREGLIELGETVGRGFYPWEGTIEEVCRRIDDAAAAATFPVLVSELFWMRNTRRGNDFIRRLNSSVSDGAGS